MLGSACGALPRASHGAAWWDVLMLAEARSFCVLGWSWVVSRGWPGLLAYVDLAGVAGSALLSSGSRAVMPPLALVVMLHIVRHGKHDGIYAGSCVNLMVMTYIHSGMQGHTPIQSECT